MSGWSRREFVATIGASTLLAGCSALTGGQDGAPPTESERTDTRTPTPTDTPTDTPTPTRTPTETPAPTPAPTPTPTSTPASTPDGTTVAPESVGDDPRRLIVQFYRYLDDGNTGAAGKLVHPDSPLRDGSGELFGDAESVRAMEQNDVSVRSVSYRSAEESRAVMSALVSLSEDSEATTVSWEVRKADGKWRIWKQG